MIPIKLKVLLVVGAILIIIILINMIKKYKLELKYAILWMALGIVLIPLALFPKLSYGISKLIGIETPVNTIFLLSFICTLSIIFSLTIAISNQSTRIKDLSQELAILKYETEKKQIEAIRRVNDN